MVQEIYADLSQTISVTFYFRKSDNLLVAHEIGGATTSSFNGAYKELGTAGVNYILNMDVEITIPNPIPEDDPDEEDCNYSMKIWGPDPDPLEDGVIEISSQFPNILDYAWIFKFGSNSFNPKEGVEYESVTISDYINLHWEIWGYDRKPDERENAYIIGNVSDNNGNPVADRNVGFATAGSSMPYPRATTDINGDYEIVLSALKILYQNSNIQSGGQYYKNINPDPPEAIFNMRTTSIDTLYVEIAGEGYMKVEDNIHVGFSETVTKNINILFSDGGEIPEPEPPEDIYTSISANSNSIAEWFFSTAFKMSLEASSLTSLITEKWFPIVRTNMLSRIQYGAFASGTLLRTGPYEEELWDRDIEGFFEYIPATSSFDEFGARDTMPIRLPVKRAEVTTVKITEDITVSDTEIFIEEIPADWELLEGEYGFLEITDGEQVEKIGYELIEQREIDGTTVNVIVEIDRGVLESKPKNFLVANETVLYTSILTMSLSWDDEIKPLGKRTEYKFRAGINVDTRLSTTGESKTFTFYGGERKLGIDESEPASGLEMGELFIDARDLEFEDELFDRAKLKFEELEFESWNIEEFKEWTWEEFKDTEITAENFQNMTFEELIKIAGGITVYTEKELVNNYSREEIERIIQDKLDIVTADEINFWDFDVGKLAARLLTMEPSGAYTDWTEKEVKDFLISMLTNEFSFADFEDSFPFAKWETIMKSRLEVTVNNNASIEIEYNQYGPYNYGVDFQLGDIIVVEYPEVFRAMIRIIEVKEEYTQEGKKYTLTLGKEFETLITKLKADKDSISGRL